jgi:hypothetical protein
LIQQPQAVQRTVIRRGTRNHPHLPPDGGGSEAASNWPRMFFDVFYDYRIDGRVLRGAE